MSEAGKFGFDVAIKGSIRDERLISIETAYGGQVFERIIDVEDQLIREGLIRLGWTPPAEAENRD